MSPKELLLQEIEQAPEFLLREVLNFFLFLKARYKPTNGITAQSEVEATNRIYHLRGLPVQLVDPFEPIAEDDWDAVS